MEPTLVGRTVKVMVFSFTATALTGARKAAHSLGCCSKAGGVVCSSKKRWSTRMSPVILVTPSALSSWTRLQRSAVPSDGSPNPRRTIGPTTALPLSVPARVVSKR